MDFTKEEDELWTETYYHLMRSGHSVEDAAKRAGESVLLYRRSKASINKQWAAEGPTPPTYPPGTIIVQGKCNCS